MHVPSLCCAAVLALAAAPAAALTLADTVDLALRGAPALRAGEATVGIAAASRPAATTLPDPKLAVGVESLPIAGADRFSTTRDTATMQRLALMQEVPNRAKREARAQVADARLERERRLLAAGTLAVRRDATLAWLAVHYTERRLALLAEIEHENRLLQDTLAPRIAAGRAMPADLTMARQDALAIADRADMLRRDLRRARAELQRWAGPRAAEPTEGEPATPAVQPDALRAALHRHAELAPYDAMRALAGAEMAEAEAEKRGDWSWELAYNRRPRYDDMVSFQLTFDLPWQRGQRQQPAVDAKRRELDRIDAEREDTLRRHAAELDTMLADWQAAQAQLERLRGSGQALAAERIALALAAYEAGRGELAGVLTARAQAVDLRLRAVDLEAETSALAVRLNSLIAE